jgi:hypothetical protein
MPTDRDLAETVDAALTRWGCVRDGLPMWTITHGQLKELCTDVLALLDRDPPVPTKEQEQEDLSRVGGVPESIDGDLPRQALVLPPAPAPEKDKY